MNISNNTQNKKATSPDIISNTQDSPGVSQTTETEINEGATPKRFYRRRITRIIAIGLLFSLLMIIGSWIQYQSRHVISNNAVVRGQITEVGARFNGMLAITKVGEGDRVQAGQELARLANQHIHAEIQEIQAQIEALEREIKLEHSTIEYERLKRKTQLEEANARAAAVYAESIAAKSRADEANAFFKARQNLLERQLISRDLMRQAEAEHRTALAMANAVQANKAAADSAKRNALLELDSLTLREQHLEVLDANLRAAKAQLRRAQADLEGTIIRAPSDGTVIRWLIKTGGSVRVGKPIVLMSMGDEIWIEAWIDEDQINRINIGNPVTVTLPSHSGQELKGYVKAIGVATDYEQPAEAVPQPRATRMRGTPVISVLVQLQDISSSTLLPGLSATVAILGKDH
jgi:multidrug resistance efflux pump